MVSYVQHARQIAQYPVRDSLEFRRIDQLPRRLVPDVPVDWADSLRRPGGTLRLRATQAQALCELAQVGGLLADMPVGSGKTLVLLLAGVVLGAKRIVLLVPSSLKAKTEADITYYGAHFVLPDALHVLSYEALSQAKNTRLLATLNPDLICGDEAHRIARTSSARFKVLKLFRASRPDCRYVWASGTLITRSIKDCAGLSNYALGPKSPYPRDYRTLEEWSAAVDDGVLFRSDPGVLERWYEPGESTRDGLRRRVRETLGVVGGSATDQCTASLIFRDAKVKVPKALMRVLKDLRTKWELPGGEELEDPLSVHRALQDLACGYYLRWTWPRGEAPELQRAWLTARAAWNRAVYQALKGRPKQGMTSPLLLYQAAADGRWDCVDWAPWAAIRKQCRPKSEVVWISDFMVDAVAKWTKTHNGIVWVNGPALGACITEVTGLPYYGGGGEAQGKLLLSETGSRAIIVSINAHRDGLNLQGPFGEAYYTCVPTTSTPWTQSLGRIHRPGQERDEVSIYISQHTPELREALIAARDNADFIYEIQGSEGLLRRGTWLVM